MNFGDTISRYIESELILAVRTLVSFWGTLQTTIISGASVTNLSNNDFDGIHPIVLLINQW